jgi:hypothetical protein
LALGFDWGGKKELEKIVSAWRRYVDVSISMVELMCESAVGKGRESRYNEDEDEGAWCVCRWMHVMAPFDLGVGSSFLIQVVCCSHHWSPTPFLVSVPCSALMSLWLMHGHIEVNEHVEGLV